MARTGIAAWMGHDKEPPKHHPRKVGGKGPLVHSHSAKLKRKVSPRKHGMMK